MWSECWRFVVERGADECVVRVSLIPFIGCPSLHNCVEVVYGVAQIWDDCLVIVAMVVGQCCCDVEDCELLRRCPVYQKVCTLKGGSNHPLPSWGQAPVPIWVVGIEVSSQETIRKRFMCLEKPCCFLHMWGLSVYNFCWGGLYGDCDSSDALFVSGMDPGAQSQILPDVRGTFGVHISS